MAGAVTNPMIRGSALRSERTPGELVLRNVSFEEVVHVA